MTAATDSPTLRALPAAGDDDGRDWGAIYAAWAYAHGRNAARTAKAFGLPERTVQHRARVDGWAERADREAAELSADARAAVRAMLHHNAAEMVAALVKIAKGQGDTRTVLDKDGNAVEVTDPVPYQARVNAITAGLDRIGLVGASKTIIEAEPPRRTGAAHRAADLADAAPEDLGAALLARLAVGS